MNKKNDLTIGWLYPDLMSTYGDKGNVMIIKHIAQKKSIKIKILYIQEQSSAGDIMQSDILFMGGAQDLQQEIVSGDLKGKKLQALSECINNGVPGLYICGAFQFLGKFYETADKKRVHCLNILPIYTKQPKKNKPRIIGDIVTKLSYPLLASQNNKKDLYLIGFENHGGRTYVDDPNNSLGKVIKGGGNNGQDNTEGYVYKNTIATYMHGPFLARNPFIADFLINKALERKYNKKITPKETRDVFVEKNRRKLLKEFGIIKNN